MSIKGKQTEVDEKQDEFDESEWDDWFLYILKIGEEIWCFQQQIEKNLGQ